MTPFYSRYEVIEGSLTLEYQEGSALRTIVLTDRTTR